MTNTKLSGWNLLLSRGFSAAAYFSLFPYLLTLLVDSFHFSLTNASIAIALSLLAARVLGSSASDICDKYGTGTYLLYSNVLAAALTGGLIALSSDYSFAAVLILLARGAIGAGQSVAYRIAVLERLGKENAVKSFARLNLAFNAGVVIGPALTVIAPVADKGALWIPLGMQALAAMSSEGWTGNRSVSNAPKSKPSSFSVSALWESLKLLGGPFIVIFMCQWVFLQQLNLSLAFYCQEQLGSQTYASFFFSFQAAISLLGTFAFTRMKLKFEKSQYLKIILIGGFIESISFVFIPGTPGAIGWALMALFAVVITISEIISAPVFDAYVVAVGDDSNTSRLFGAMTIIQAIGMTIGSLSSGVLLKISKDLGMLNDYWNVVFLVSLIFYTGAYFWISKRPVSLSALDA